MVIFSLASPKQDWDCIVKNVIGPLYTYYAVRSVFFERSVVRGDVAGWLEDMIKSCDKVLLVYNKEFAMEWREPSSVLLTGESIVYATQQIVHGYVLHNRNYLEKFAVLYLRRKDQDYMDSCYLQNVGSFLVDPHDHAKLDLLAQFITGTPTIIFA